MTMIELRHAESGMIFSGEQGSLQLSVELAIRLTVTNIYKTTNELQGIIANHFNDKGHVQFIAKPTGSEWLLRVLEIDKDMMLQFHGNIGMILSSEGNSIQLNGTEFALQASGGIQS